MFKIEIRMTLKLKFKNGYITYNSELSIMLFKNEPIFSLFKFIRFTTTL